MKEGENPGGKRALRWAEVAAAAVIGVSLHSQSTQPQLATQQETEITGTVIHTVLLLLRTTVCTGQQMPSSAEHMPYFTNLIARHSQVVRT